MSFLSTIFRCKNDPEIEAKQAELDEVMRERKAAFKEFRDSIKQLMLEKNVEGIGGIVMDKDLGAK